MTTDLITMIVGFVVVGIPAAAIAAYVIQRRESQNAINSGCDADEVHEVNGDSDFKTFIGPPRKLIPVIIAFVLILIGLSHLP